MTGKKRRALTKHFYSKTSNTAYNEKKLCKIDENEEQKFDNKI